MNMGGRGGNRDSDRGGRSREGGGRGRGGGYDWRKHIRPSSDPAVLNEVREAIQSFLDSGSMKQEIRCGGGEEKNTYKQYCKQMGVGWARGSRKGCYQMMRFTSSDPSMTLWKKVWCFYFSHYCDVDLVVEAKNNMEIEIEDGDAKPSTDDDMMGDAKPSPSTAADGMHGTDLDEAAAILRLQQNNENDNETGEDEPGNDSKFVLDSTSKSFDGKRMWTKVRDLLMDIKRNDEQLWAECCSLGVNNCSEKKLESHIEQVEKFFDLQGRGPTQKIRGKQLQVAVGGDESVHFLEAGENHVIEYAKPVKFCDTVAIGRLIKLVDKANVSLKSGSSQNGSDEYHLPFNIFNDNWRRTRRNFDLGERLHGDNMDPIYHERKTSLRKRLPAFNIGDEFCKRVFENDVVVLCGATG